MGINSFLNITDWASDSYFDLLENERPHKTEKFSPFQKESHQSEEDREAEFLFKGYGKAFVPIGLLNDEFESKYYAIDSIFMAYRELRPFTKGEGNFYNAFNGFLSVCIIPSRNLLTGLNRSLALRFIYTGKVINGFVKWHNSEKKEEKDRLNKIAGLCSGLAINASLLARRVKPNPTTKCLVQAAFAFSNLRHIYNLHTKYIESQNSQNKKRFSNANATEMVTRSFVVAVRIATILQVCSPFGCKECNGTTE